MSERPVAPHRFLGGHLPVHLRRAARLAVPHLARQGGRPRRHRDHSKHLGARRWLSDRRGESHIAPGYEPHIYYGSPQLAMLSLRHRLHQCSAAGRALQLKVRR
ncbi:hypothetical protein GCM10022214_05830 [Actinomadura miaoliensis]|uniref:Uncharacterized protein n=1 Tax=Actinomadura miaoliensis TaxID=430685 RepID=A0ABP7V0J5_9ACTN